MRFQSREMVCVPPLPSLFPNATGLGRALPRALCNLSAGDQFVVLLHPSDRRLMESLQELFRRQSCLRDDGAERAARQIAGMTGHHGDFAGPAVDPELVAALAGPQLHEAVAAEAGNHVPLLQCREAAHAGTGRATGSGSLSALDLRLKTRRKAGGRGSFSER